MARQAASAIEFSFFSHRKSPARHQETLATHGNAGILNRSFAFASRIEIGIEPWPSWSATNSGEWSNA
jgi:hypothetical protein